MPRKPKLPDPPEGVAAVPIPAALLDELVKGRVRQEFCVRGGELLIVPAVHRRQLQTGEGRPPLFWFGFARHHLPLLHSPRCKRLMAASRSAFSGSLAHRIPSGQQECISRFSVAPLLNSA